MLRLLTALLLLSFAALHAQSDSAALEHLRAAFTKKIFLLRGFPQDPLLQYDADGNLKHHAESGSWTTSYFLVNSLSDDNGRLTLKGTRVVRIFNDKKHQLGFARTDDKLMATVEYLAPLDENAAYKAIAHVFVGANEPLVSMTPDYWHYVIEHLDANNNLKTEEKDSAKKEDCGDSPSVDHPCRVGKEIKAPKPISTPDPEYGTLGRALHVAGQSLLRLVLDETGRPQRIEIRKPLGVGLDESAIERILTWRFQPATRNGTPVPVVVNVEMNYRWSMPSLLP